jgi:SAM-dependent methyltransferase
MAQALMKGRPGILITGVDVRPRPQAAIPVLRYDGQRLPFADSSFDLVLLIDILHHTEDPSRVLAEASRVARRGILIKDHYWESRWDHWLLSVSDYLGNRAYDVPLPYAFLRLEEWAHLFRAGELTVVSMDRFRFSALDRCKQVVFLVEGALP